MPAPDEHEARGSGLVQESLEARDVGEDRGQPFIAMEFIDGESMAEMIRRRAPLPVPRRTATDRRALRRTRLRAQKRHNPP